MCFSTLYSLLSIAVSYILSLSSTRASYTPSHTFLTAPTAPGLPIMLAGWRGIDRRGRAFRDVRRHSSRCGSRIHHAQAAAALGRAGGAGGSWVCKPGGHRRLPDPTRYIIRACVVHLPFHVIYATVCMLCDMCRICTPLCDPPCPDVHLTPTIPPL